jgi:hypothetical protein
MHLYNRQPSHSQFKSSSSKSSSKPGNCINGRHEIRGTPTVEKVLIHHLLQALRAEALRARYKPHEFSVAAKTYLHQGVAIVRLRVIVESYNKISICTSF